MIKVKFDFNMPDLASVWRQKEEEVFKFIIAVLQTNRGLIFLSSGAYNGRSRWAPLVLRNGLPLLDRGNLMKSFGPIPSMGVPGPGGYVRIEQQAVTIGTSLAYAELMNDGTTKMPGGVLKSPTGKALMIPLPPGKQATNAAKSLRADAYTLITPNKRTGRNQRTDVIFRKSVKIPARPYNDWTQEDEDEISDALSEKIAEILNV